MIERHPAGTVPAGADTRKIIITTIHKFGEADSLNERSNIIVMVDEAHCTQEGDGARCATRRPMPSA